MVLLLNEMGIDIGWLRRRIVIIIGFFTDERMSEMCYLYIRDCDLV